MLTLLAFLSAALVLRGFMALLAQWWLRASLSLWCALLTDKGRG